MGNRKYFAGEHRHPDEPSWKALEAAASAMVLPQFIWICEIELQDGRKLQVYRSKETRRFLHLDDEGKAWTEMKDGRFTQGSAWFESPPIESALLCPPLGEQRASQWRRSDEYISY